MRGSAPRLLKEVEELTITNHLGRVHPNVANLLGSVSILLTTGRREQDAHTTN